MTTAIICPICGTKAFHSRFEPAQAASQFLWIKRPAKAAQLVLVCLRCGWENAYEPGSIKASLNVMRGLEFDLV